MTTLLLTIALIAYALAVTFFAVWMKRKWDAAVKELMYERAVVRELAQNNDALRNKALLRAEREEWPEYLK